LPPIECDLLLQWTRSVDLSDDVGMSDTSNGSRGSSGPREDSGVLANLPHTRPQRSSPRRAAARRGTTPAAKTASAAAAPAKAKTRKDSKKPDPAKRATSTKRTAETVPRQGFESEREIGSGSVQPPGSTEFVAAAAEIVGELTKAGLSRGERLMRDVLSRLPLS
jgi:hypothetical protein